MRLISRLCYSEIRENLVLGKTMKKFLVLLICLTSISLAMSLEQEKPDYYGYEREITPCRQINQAVLGIYYYTDLR